MKEDLENLCQQVVNLSKKVGEFIVNEFYNFDRDRIEYKEFNDPVSYVDKTAEEMYVKRLSELLPSAGFICEEGHGEKNEEGYNWVIDPLDGTTNFVHGIPFFCSSIALMYNGKTLLGVVTDFIHDKAYYAIKDKGAFCNSKSLKIDRNKTTEQAVIATSFPGTFHPKLPQALDFIVEILPKIHGLRRLGAAALELSMVADGKLDAFFESGLKPWDVAAASLIVQEAGGVVSDYQDEENYIFGRQILAAPEKIHHDIVKLFSEKAII
ncbi:inositol monophosphatase family protein [Chondrinema litorale]|uniref:inositol monophosphatase family protein n=1 Tax=Chondrinema litorale TaxID=2994555 RepID=UPI00254372F9|nr:inositol monophosphatase family protein [Chondrinema litorale]UZR95338.1 inositol monophosphatase family protein [Chondrinema litorale]